MIDIHIENSGKSVQVNTGITLLELLAELENPEQYVAAYIDGVAHTLQTEVYSPHTIRFIERSSAEGQRVYARTLIFMLGYVTRELLGTELIVLHPMGSGYFCKLEGRSITTEDIKTIELRIRDLVANSLTISHNRVSFAEAIDIFSTQGDRKKLELHSSQKSYYLELYNIEGYRGDLYGALLHSTAVASHFELRALEDGMALLLPTKEDPYSVQTLVELPKLYEEFRRNEKWLDVMGVPTVGALNSKIRAGKGDEIVNLGEGLQEKRFSELADKIYAQQQQDGLRLVFIAGPSSSGKTTFAKRLSTQLSILGLEPRRISLDDYFVERSKTPLDENGEYDFECLESLDLDEFNDDLHSLLSGQEVQLPRFNFVEGVSKRVGDIVKLSKRSILLIEGIHGLNPRLSATIARRDKFLIYVSALTALSIDSTAIIHTSDNRLLRRIVRDHNFRGKSAADTITQWASVQRGEQRHIFPYQEQADAMFNTALLFEFSILRHYAEPLLRDIEAGSEQYYEARRLLSFLEYFVHIPVDKIPNNSLLREFLGGSSFSY